MQAKTTAKPKTVFEQRKALFGDLIGSDFVENAFKLPPDDLQDKYHGRFREVGVGLMRHNPDVQEVLAAEFPNENNDGVSEDYYEEMYRDKAWVDTYFLRTWADVLGFRLNFEDMYRGQKYSSGDDSDVLTLVRTAQEGDKNGHFEFRNHYGNVTKVSRDGNCGPRAMVGAIQAHILTYAKSYTLQQNTSSYPQMTAMMKKPLSEAQIQHARTTQQTLYATSVTQPSADTEAERLQVIKNITDKKLQASIIEQIAADEAFALQLAAEYAEEDAASASCASCQ